MSTPDNSPPEEIAGQYADWLADNMEQLDDINLGALARAVKAEINKRRGGGTAPEPGGTPQAAPEQAQKTPAATDTSEALSEEPMWRRRLSGYYNAVITFMNPERAVPLDRQLLTMGAFWEARGVTMPAPSFTQGEWQAMSDYADTHPNLGLIATPLPLDASERENFFVPVGQPDGGESDDPFMRPNPQQPHGQPLGLDTGAELNDDRTVKEGGDFDKAYNEDGWYEYQEKTTVGRKLKEVKVGDPLQMRLAYFDDSGQATEGRQRYLERLYAEVAGTTCVKNGEEYWLYQFVDLSRPTVTATPRLPEDAMRAVMPTATPEVAMTLALMRNDAGEFEPHATVRKGYEEPIVVVNEVLLGRNPSNEVVSVKLMGLSSFYDDERGVTVHTVEAFRPEASVPTESLANITVVPMYRPLPTDS